jgi:hypothetical protein
MSIEEQINDLTYPEVVELIFKLQARERELYPSYSKEKRSLSMIRSQQRRLNEERLEAAGEQMFDEVNVGDIVRITGMRDHTFPYREITGKNGRNFTGWQVRQMRDGSVVRGSEHTSHMANKIRGILVKDSKLVG